MIKPRVLCVDDEPHVLESLRDTLRRHFQVQVTTNSFEALRMLTHDPCKVVLSDMQMPLLNGARFLTLARQHAPDTVRVVLTGQATTASAAVNEGEIFRLLTKPCSTDDLVRSLKDAVEHHDEAIRRRQLLADSERATANSLLALTATVDVTTRDRAARIRQSAIDLARAASKDVPPELERACELMQVGAIALSHDALQRLAAGTRLAPEEANELERLPELALPYLRPVASFAGTVGILERMARPDTTPPASAPALAAALLRIALDYEALERQDAPMETALRTLIQRRRRYVPTLLDTFTELIRNG